DKAQLDALMADKLSFTGAAADRLRSPSRHDATSRYAPAPGRTRATRCPPWGRPCRCRPTLPGA
ncbi:hypothetical protein, partial [Streptomyces decoyicus]|uniref:hypothetical protein n=1 Tax=Streptomyces decoyicus TaxID=249567 RepID=UPI003F536A97